MWGGRLLARTDSKNTFILHPFVLLDSRFSGKALGSAIISTPDPITCGPVCGPACDRARHLRPPT